MNKNIDHRASSQFSGPHHKYTCSTQREGRGGSGRKKLYRRGEGIVCMVASSTHHGSELKGQHVLQCWRKILASRRLGVNICTKCNIAYLHCTYRGSACPSLNCTSVNDTPILCTHITFIRTNFLALFQVHFKCILPMLIPCMFEEGYQTYLSFRAYVIGFLHVLFPRLES